MSPIGHVPPDLPALWNHSAAKRGAIAALWLHNAGKLRDGWPRAVPLREQVDEQFSGVRRYFQEVLSEGQRRGEIDPEVSPADVAQVVINLLWGLAMDAGFRSTPARVQRTLAAIRQVLDGVVVRDRSVVPD